MDSSERKNEPQEYEVGRSHTGIWAAAIIVALVIVCIFAFGDTHRQQQKITQLTAHESDMNSTISQLQGQLGDMSAKLNNVQAEQSAAAANAAAQEKAAKTPRHVAPDPRWNKVQGQLDSQAQQLTSEQSAIDNAQNSINQTRSDLEVTINSNHDELSGSIARTHDELVALEQRGERNYDEFDLKKGKNNRFYRVGPISIALRKADPKHKQYNIAMVIDDNQIQKKNVALYEPISLRDSDNAQPLEIVVNKIDKDHIHGYVSSPKYSQAQMTPTSAPANGSATQTPATDSVPAPASNPQSN
ncbi:MAG TPA: hypothetical protein VIY69_12475 [Candidatus Acidoferrales bacterium]